MGAVPLSTLLAHCPHELVQGDLDLLVQGVKYDSRAVQAGDLFVALRGLKHDSHSFIGDALRQGCAVVVGEDRKALEQVRQQGVSCVLVLVPDSRLALAHLAAAFYQHPSRHLKLVGITGTSGKTTTTYLLESIFQASGATVGVIGTINYRYNGWEVPAEHTTPEAPHIQRLLQTMVQEKVQYCVMEVSSHALEWKRVGGCHFAAALFTNLSQDHLDFHPDEEHYFQAKARLFLDYPVGIAVINGDDPWGKRLINLLSRPFLTYGRGEQNEITMYEMAVDTSGIRGHLKTPQGSIAFHSSLLGEYNVMNILAAAAVASGLGIDLPAIKTGIEAVSTVPGRFEQIHTGQDFLVVVDYSHKPEALRGILLTVRGLATQRVITVFGCGGDRDRSKRPVMGEIAASYSDYVIITSDNPRTEDPLAIIHAIAEGVQRVKPLKPYLIIPERREAIEKAINLASTGDVVVIAGKGHETYQILGERVIPFDDRVVARDALLKRQGVKG